MSNQIKSHKLKRRKYVHTQPHIWYEVAVIYNLSYQKDKIHLIFISWMGLVVSRNQKKISTFIFLFFVTGHHNIILVADILLHSVSAGSIITM